MPFEPLSTKVQGIGKVVVVVVVVVVEVLVLVVVVVVVVEEVEVVVVAVGPTASHPIKNIANRITPIR
jgi:hypothetical protein